jgi:hypothetical protein
MNPAVAATLVLFTLSDAHAASLLSEQQAHAKAIEILKGDPYGTTTAQVAANIKQAQLIRDGHSRACREAKKLVWEFHVITRTAEQRIDGYLALDARTGKLVCTNLPLLD